MNGGSDSVTMLRALLSGIPYPPPGITDTPANQARWAAISKDLEDMPAGVLPQIPGEWADLPDDNGAAPGGTAG